MDLSRLKITSAKNGCKEGCLFNTSCGSGNYTAGPGDVVPVDVVVEPAAEDVEGGHGHPKCCHRPMHCKNGGATLTPGCQNLQCSSNTGGLL